MANRAREIPFKDDDFKEVLNAYCPHEERRKWLATRRPWGGPSPAQPVAVHLGFVPSTEMSADHGR